MVKMGVWAAAFAGCLFASQAFAQAEGGSFSKLSPGNQKIVEAMHDNQAVPDGSAALTLDQIADFKADSGWGNAFKAMQAEGRFPEYKNLGEVVSTQNRLARDARKSGEASEAAATTETGLARPDKASKDLKHAERVERTAKIDRPEKLERPDKPDRPAKIDRPQRPDRPERR
jgi:hypothetical protein